jgi:hypothetical protein
MAACETAKLSDQKSPARFAVIVRATAEKSCTVAVISHFEKGGSKTLYFPFKIDAKQDDERDRSGG